MELEPILFHYRARDLRAEDIAQIRGAIASHYARGRSFIARVLLRKRCVSCGIGASPTGATRSLRRAICCCGWRSRGSSSSPPRQRVKSNVSKKTYAQIPLYTHQELSGTVGDFAAPMIEQVGASAQRTVGLPVAPLPLLGAPQAGGPSTSSKWCSSMLKWWLAWGGPVQPGRSLRGTVTSGGPSRSSARVCTSSPITFAF